MNNNPLFLSIIIPVYNTEKFLQECLDSCLNQDFPHDQYEIICINDGSTDNSAEILLSYEKKYKNVFVVDQSNKGISPARNKAVGIANGKYLWFVDSDDFISPGFIKELHDKYYHENYDMILFGSYSFKDSLSADETEQYKNGTLRPNRAILTVRVTSRLIKKSFMETNGIYFHEDVLYGEDLLFDYITYVYNPRVAVFDELGYYYRIHSASTMRNKSYEGRIRYIDSHITGIKIVKSFYDKEEKKRFRSIKYILDDFQYILDVISKLPFDKAKEQICKLRNIDVLPFKKFESFRIKDFIITLYTNIRCCIFVILVRISTNKAGFRLLKYESEFMNGKTLKKIIHYLKKKYSHLSKD